MHVGQPLQQVQVRHARGVLQLGAHGDRVAGVFVRVGLVEGPPDGAGLDKPPSAVAGIISWPYAPLGSSHNEHDCSPTPHRQLGPSIRSWHLQEKRRLPSLLTAHKQEMQADRLRGLLAVCRHVTVVPDLPLAPEQPSQHAPLVPARLAVVLAPTPRRAQPPQRSGRSLGLIRRPTKQRRGSSQETQASRGSPPPPRLLVLLLRGLAVSKRLAGESSVQVSG